MSKKPLLIADPFPQSWGNIFTNHDRRRRLEEMVSINYSGDDKMADVVFDGALPDAVAVAGQTAMPKERLVRAKKLKAIFNVEGNFQWFRFSAHEQGGCGGFRRAHKASSRWPIQGGK